ncbi:DUF4230 domain-containing protein [Heliorestis acidaminivorans]|uniref:DUF4230 domain-containing protein n=1 Tax=Heliorestis acidaminivorans TaxID=553427 RepID=A0A6I0EV54_9FIRM|nr:DUF4230 domain-containing protein [Heliorestis acidaminivorans]KAB2953344.1 DUF4230 domain-containing protein [Heliorestis acidaminivorans]
MIRLATKAIPGLLVLIIAILLILSLNQLYKQKDPEKSKIVMYLNEIREVAKLVTLEHNASITIAIDDPLRWHDFGLVGTLTSLGSEPVPRTSIKYIAVGQGTVLIGIDADKIELIEQPQGELILQLPQPEVLYQFINVDSWEVLYQQEPYVRKFIKPLNREEIRKLEAEALTALVQEVQENGLLEEAAEKAKLEIEKLLEEKEIATVKIAQA